MRALCSSFSSRAVLLLALPLGCAQATPPPPPPAAPGSLQARLPDPTPPSLRLPASVKPQRVTLDLTIDPRAPTFTGTITIDVTLAEATRAIWLHATDLTLRDAIISAAGERQKARVIKGGEDFAGLVLERPLAPGAAQVTVAWEGKLDAERSQGLYKQSEGDGPGDDNTYVYSMFEPAHARRAFPCFDEPGFKVPWKITIHARKEHLALANAPVEKETEEPNGWKAVTFAETRPLPSYLVALVVGPFEIVDAGKAGHHDTPLRFVVPKGRGYETRYAAEVTPKIVGLLEDYWGMPYPYGKLDVAVVPRYRGTMEHPGLLAMGQPLTLIKPAEESALQRRAYANVAAHELSHYWFGDYVTMDWWDDTWLNEAMATWLDAKITSQVEPAWQYPLSALSQRGNSMRADELASAKRLREPITSSHDIQNAFDGALTYYKGSAVAAMFEHWLGAEAFQRGLRQYMSQHAFGSATADDFLGALDSASGKAVGAAYRTFLDQPGVPEISAECKAEPPRLELSQRRFVPIGSEAPADKVYSVPVCVKYGSGKATGKACTLLAERTAELPLEGETRCPDWVMLNEGAAGYYHSRYRRGELNRLLGKERGKIDEAERLMLVYDVEAAVTSGALPLGEALGLAPAMVAEKSRPQVLGSLSLVRWARRMLPDALQPKLVAFVQSTYGPLARELGFVRKPGESDAVGLLRPVVLWAAAEGEDPALLAEAKALALKWLDDRRAVDRSTRSLVLYAATHAGDRALWERVRAEAKKTADRQERADLLEALGEFRDPALLRESFALVLGGEFDLRESFSIVATALGDRETRDAALEYVKSNFDALAGKMRSDEPGRLLFTAPGVFCDEAHRADAEAFFGPRAAKLEGAPRRLANTLDQMSVCIAQARVHEKSVEEFLDKATAAKKAVSSPLLRR